MRSSNNFPLVQKKAGASHRKVWLPLRWGIKTATRSCPLQHAALYAMRSIMLLVIFLSNNTAIACSILVLPPKTVPPSEPTGTFVEEPVLTDRELFLHRMSTAPRIAVVDMYADFHYSKEPSRAQTEFEVIYGWGKPLSRYIKYVRSENSCGKLDTYKQHAWHVVLARPDDYMVWPLSEIQKEVEALGSPDYKYSEMGIRRN